MCLESDARFFVWPPERGGCPSAGDSRRSYTPSWWSRPRRQAVGDHWHQGSARRRSLWRATLRRLRSAPPPGLMQGMIDRAPW